MNKKSTPKKPAPLILVADDNEEMRLYLRHILSREGWEVADAVDGEEALRVYQEVSPVLVLLDAVMPKMDGFTVCRKIRALGAGQQVPIIMVTALDDSKSIDLAFEAGASEYITKPVHWNFLLQRVEHLLLASQAEDQIRRSEASLREAQRIAHMGNWDWDIVGDTLHWSDEIYRIFGQEPQSFPGTYEAFLASVHPEDLESVKQGVAQALEQNKPYDITHRIFLPNGEERFVHERAEVTFDQNRRPLSMIGTVQDVTRKQQVEQQLKEYSEGLEQKVHERTAELETQKIRAERANLAKTEFLANMSHELKTPLSSIISFADILQQEMVGPLNVEQKDLLAEIQDSSGQLREMVTVILRVARLEAGETVLQTKRFGLREMIDGAMERFRKSADAKKLRLESLVSDDMDELHADEELIFEVLVLLLDNAVKFSPPGKTVRIEANQTPGQAELCVIDSGPGISRKDLDRLFLPFGQLDSSMTKKHGGVGMGLYLAKKVIELHGGQIRVESVVGEGSRFYLTLPQPHSLPE